jgi:hypothetical protein
MSEGAEGFGESGAGEAGDVDAIGGGQGLGLLGLFYGFFVGGLGTHGGIIAHYFFMCNVVLESREARSSHGLPGRGFP